MSGCKKKKYMHEDGPLTRYGVTKFKKLINNKTRSHHSISDEPVLNNMPCDAKETDTDLMKSDFQNFQEGEYNIGCNKNSDTLNIDFQSLLNDSNDNSNDYDSDDELIQILEKKDRSNAKYDLNSEFFNNISLSINVKPAEVLLMILKCSLLQRLPMEGLLKLLKIVNHLCGTIIIPETKYFIQQIIGKENYITLHGVCPQCSNYLGKFEELGQSIKCDMCEMNVDVSCPSSPCFFAFIDPSTAVKHYLELHEDYYNHVVTERKREKGHLKDIYDGKLYRNFVTKVKMDNTYYATAIFNCDGAPVFKSSKYAIWPMYLILNEIPVQARMKSFIVCSLWFGLNKPDMSIFLDIFVENMNELSVKGISCSIKQCNHSIKLFPILSCVDTVARAPMNGTNQFNGKYGCDWCLHPGQYYGGSMRYPFLVPPSGSRNQDNTIQFAQEAIKNGTAVYGVKSASPLLNLQYFDIINGFVPDYMHCYLAGVAAQITEQILLKVNKDDMKHMDDILQNISAPHHIGRLTRPLSQREKWKAREWENWVLYYSLPVLQTVVKDHDILKHWNLLVESLHICLQSDMKLLDLNRANKMLYDFVSQVEDMYSLNCMTYNVHMLLHISESCYNWGPLWAHSTFPFESANHNLLTSIHCAKGVILQIIQYIEMQHFVEKLEKKVYPQCSGITLDFFQSVLDSNKRNVLKISKSITYIGKGKTIDETVKETFQLPATTLMFTKIIFKNCLLATSQKINRRSCNYYIQLLDENFVKVNYFLVDIESKKEYIICNVLETAPSSYCEYHKLYTGTKEQICIASKHIKTICCVIKSNSSVYVSPLPNLYSY